MVVLVEVRRPIGFFVLEGLRLDLDEEILTVEDVRRLVDFVTSTQRGYVRGARRGARGAGLCRKAAYVQAADG